MALVIVVRDEGLDPGLEITRQVVVLEQDAVLQRLMPSLDLFLGLRMIGGTAGVLLVPLFEPVGQLAGDIARSVVGDLPGGKGGRAEYAQPCVFAA